MKVTHVLMDGTRVDDISGHVVKAKDSETVYQLIESINKRGFVSCKTKKEGKRC